MQFLKIPSLVLACCSNISQKQITCMVFWGNLLAPADRTLCVLFYLFLKTIFNFSLKTLLDLRLDSHECSSNSLKPRLWYQLVTSKNLQPILTFQKQPIFIMLLQKGFQFINFRVSQKHQHKTEEWYDHAFALPWYPEVPETIHWNCKPESLVSYP